MQMSPFRKIVYKLNHLNYEATIFCGFVIEMIQFIHYFGERDSFAYLGPSFQA